MIHGWQICFSLQVAMRIMFIGEVRTLAIPGIASNSHGKTSEALVFKECGERLIMFIL